MVIEAADRFAQAQAAAKAARSQKAVATFKTIFGKNPQLREALTSMVRSELETRNGKRS